MTEPIITVVVDGKPQPWQRARHGKAGIPFTPAHVRQYQDVLRLAAQNEMAGRALVEGPVNLAVRAYIPIPQSWSKKKTAAALRGELLPTTRPDLSNYVKLPEDVFNLVVWRDDSQVVSYDGTFKAYSDRPRIEVEVSLKAPVAVERPAIAEGLFAGLEAA